MEDELQEQNKILLDVFCLVLREFIYFFDLLVMRFQEVKVNVIIVELLNGGCFNFKVEEVISVVFCNVLFSYLFNLKVVNLWLVEMIFLFNSFDVID